MAVATTATKSDVKSAVRAVIIAVAITLTFAGLYYALCAMNPALAKSSVMGVPFGKTIRLATALKAFVLVSPFASVGNALGSLAFNLQQGDTVSWLMVYVHTFVGLGFWSWAKKWGRSLTKDLTILSVYGVVNGSLAAMKLTAISMLVANETWSKFLETAVLWKVTTSALTLVAGYLAVRAFDAARKGPNEGRTSK